MLGIPDRRDDKTFAKEEEEEEGGESAGLKREEGGCGGWMVFSQGWDRSGRVYETNTIPARDGRSNIHHI